MHSLIFLYYMLNSFSFRMIIKQYQQDRDPRDKLFEFKRALVHFAIDPYEVHITTRLNGGASIKVEMMERGIRTILNHIVRHVCGNSKVSTVLRYVVCSPRTKRSGYVFTPSSMYWRKSEISWIHI